MRTRKALAGLVAATTLATGTLLTTEMPAQAAVTHCSSINRVKALGYGLQANTSQSVIVVTHNCRRGHVRFKRVTQIVLQWWTNRCMLRFFGHTTSLQFDVTIAYGNAGVGREYHRNFYIKCDPSSTAPHVRYIHPGRRIGRVYRSWDEWNVTLIEHKTLHSDSVRHYYGNLYTVV